MAIIDENESHSDSDVIEQQDSNSMDNEDSLVIDQQDSSVINEQESSTSNHDQESAVVNHQEGIISDDSISQDQEQESSIIDHEEVIIYDHEDEIIKEQEKVIAADHQEVITIYHLEEYATDSQTDNTTEKPETDIIDHQENTHTDQQEIILIDKQDLTTSNQIENCVTDQQEITVSDQIETIVTDQKESPISDEIENIATDDDEIIPYDPTESTITYQKENTNSDQEENSISDKLEITLTDTNEIIPYDPAEAIITHQKKDVNSESITSKEIVIQNSEDSQENVNPPMIKVVDLSTMTQSTSETVETVNKESNESESNNSVSKNDDDLHSAESNASEDVEFKIKEEVTDEDVLNGLNALESCFENCSPEEFLNGLMDNSDELNDEIQIKEESQLEEGEIPPREEEFETIEEITKEEKLQLIYTEKLKTKELVAKERLNNFAKTLETAYPVYKEFLDKVEKDYGVQFCKLENSRHAPWNVRHTNRWKLKCNKIIVREDNPSLAGPRNEKPIKRIEWRITSLTDGTNIEDDPIFPPFIVNIVKKIEEFLNTNPFMQVHSIKSETISGPKSEFTAMMIRANRENQVMCVMMGNNLKTEMFQALKKFFSPIMFIHNIVSLYCKSYTIQNNIPNNSITTFLLGQQCLVETISNIKIELTPRSNYWTNAYGLEVLVKTINEFFTPLLENTTLLEIGCGIGLMSLLFTSRYARVIGIDSSSEIDEAETNRQKNNNDKVLFLREHENNVQLFFEQLKKNDNVNAIINSNSAKIGKSTDVMASIRKLNSVKRLVFLGSFNRHTTNALLELMSPCDNVLGNLPFVPVKACIVDSIPDSEHFDIVMLMQRRAIRTPASTEENASDVQVNNETIPPEPTNILENVKEQQKILEETTKKLASGNINPQLAAELRNLIDDLRQKTNSLQTQLPILASVKSNEVTTRKVEQATKRESSPVDLILEPGASKKYQRNLLPLEPNHRIGAKRGRFTQNTQSRTVPPTDKKVVPSSSLVQQAVQHPAMGSADVRYHGPVDHYERSHSPRTWSSSTSYSKQHQSSAPRRLRPISPVCPPAFDLKHKLGGAEPGLNSPESENWDEDDDNPVQVTLMRHRESSWDNNSTSSYNRQRGRQNRDPRDRNHRCHSREYSPDYDRHHSRSPRRRYYSRSRSRSRSSQSYCSRCRSRSISGSRSRSRSPYSSKRNYSPQSKRHCSSRHKGNRSNKYRENERYSSSVSPVRAAPSPNSPSRVSSPPKNNPPVVSPLSHQQYIVNRQQMSMHMQMPMQMGIPMGNMPMSTRMPLSVPLQVNPMSHGEGNIQWAPQEIEFSPDRMPIMVNPKTTEHYVSSTSMEASDMVYDSPMSPSPDNTKVEEKVRDPRLRGKIKTEDTSNYSNDEGQEMPLTGWVNGNGVAMTPDMQQWHQQQMMNGSMMMNNPWMRMPNNFARSGAMGAMGPNIGNAHGYMMQPYSWGYTTNNYTTTPHVPPGTPGPHMGSQGPMSSMLPNGVSWQGPSHYGANFSHNNHPPNVRPNFPKYVKEKQ